MKTGNCALLPAFFLPLLKVCLTFAPGERLTDLTLYVFIIQAFIAN
jgi:hypothetical protein